MNFFGCVFFSTLACCVFSKTCFQETNRARANNGLCPYKYDDKLAKAAQTHNDHMISHNCFEHQCQGEPPLGDRVTQAGYRWGGIGENLVAGVGSCQDAINSWLNSEGHRANLLSKGYRHVGCAFRTCDNNCNFNSYYTCVYASPL